MEHPARKSVAFNKDNNDARKRTASPLRLKSLAFCIEIDNNLNENCSYLQKEHIMTRLSPQAMEEMADNAVFRRTEAAAVRANRIKSEELFRQQREVEIDHQGRIYRLRLTQLNKLILTA